MKIKSIFIAVLVVCFTASMALADTVVSLSGQGGWRDFTSGNVNNSGKPYWDQQSWDGGNKNVGHFLTGTGGTYKENYLGDKPQFWGKAYSSSDDGATNPGDADTGFYFTNASPKAYVSFILEVSGMSATNKFGWFEWDSGKRHEIFSGSDTPVQTKLVTIGEDYGFYLESGNYDGSGSKIFYTGINQSWSGSITNPDSIINFALFRNEKYPNEYFLGCEDLTESQLGTGEGGIGDFNDIVVRVKPVPLPGAVLLLGAGLVRLAAYVRRRQD